MVRLGILESTHATVQALHIDSLAERDGQPDEQATRVAGAQHAGPRSSCGGNNTTPGFLEHPVFVQAPWQHLRSGMPHWRRS